MAIHSLPNITVNGKNKLCGGYIYKISYQQGFFAEPSRMVISVVNEEGKYSKVDYRKNHNIQLGDHKFVMSPITSHRVENPRGGNTLDITLVDKTEQLNKFWVGLLNKHGTKSKGCLLIVGAESNPCGNFNGSFTDECSQTTVNNDVNKTIDCQELRQITISDVSYTFSDLIAEMKRAGFKISKFKDKNPNYRNRYVGLLREVLNNWCSDYGYSYYLDQTNQSITFIDVTQGINIKFNEPSSNILLEKIVDETIEGTINRGSISYFGAEGQTRCMFDTGKKGQLVDFKRLVNCAPVSLAVMFPNGANGVNGQDFGLACILSKYSPTLRDVYFLYTKYSFSNYLNGSGLLSIPEYGNFRMVKSYSSTSNPTIFNAIFDKLPNKDSLDNAKIKFFLAYQDEAVLHQQHAFEATVASDFLGRWWYADYGRTSINAKPGPPEIITDGGTAYYYDKFSADSEDIYVPIGDEKYLLNTNLNRFILVERNASWFPNNIEVQDLEGDWSQYLPAEVTGVPSEIQQNLYDDLVNSGILIQGDPNNFFASVKLYMVIPPPIASISIASGGGVHPLESDPISSAEGGGTGINYFYGLMDKTTDVVVVNDARLFAPIGSLGGYNGQYKVIINDAIGILNKCRTLDKIETSLISVNCDSDYESLEINAIDVTSFDVHGLYRYDAGQQACVPNLAAISQIHNLYNKGLSFSTPKLFTKISYRVGGLVDIPEPKNGLLDFSIEIDSENVITTNLLVGNTAAQPPSLDYSIIKSQFGVNSAGNKYQKTLTYNKASVNS